MARVLALHQPVDPEGAALVHHVHFVALPAHHVRVPGPGARTTGNALRQGDGLRRLRRVKGKFPRCRLNRDRTRHGGNIGHRTPFEQTVHGFANAGRQRVGRRCHRRCRLAVSRDARFNLACRCDCWRINRQCGQPWQCLQYRQHRQYPQHESIGIGRA